MNWQKRFFNLVFSLVLGMGVLIAQVCNVVCLANNCADDTKVVTTETPKSSSHCHNSEPPNSQEPEPKDDAHKCQAHDLTLLLAASETKSAGAVQMDWQPVAILPARIEFIFSTQPMERIRLSALRSPPRIPQRLILRI